MSVGWKRKNVDRLDGDVVTEGESSEQKVKLSAHMTLYGFVPSHGWRLAESTAALPPLTQTQKPTEAVEKFEKAH